MPRVQANPKDLLQFLYDCQVDTVDSLIVLLESEPTVEYLSAFKLKDATQWKFLKTSVLTRIGKKSNTKILPKRA